MLTSEIGDAEGEVGNLGREEFGFRHVEFEVSAGHPRGNVWQTFRNWI